MICENCGFDNRRNKDVEPMICDNGKCGHRGCDNCIKPSAFYPGHACYDCELRAILDAVLLTSKPAGRRIKA